MQVGLQPPQAFSDQGDRQYYGGSRRRHAHDGQLQVADQEK